MTFRILALSFVLAAAGFAEGVTFPELVTNGGFETGDFTGWTVSGNVTSCLFVGVAGDPRCTPTTGIGPHSGNYAAQLGNNGGDASLSQVLNTPVGASYEVKFWLANQDYGTPVKDISVTWGSQTLYSAVNLPPFGNTYYDFAGLAAASDTTLLTFTFRNDPSYFILDDVSAKDPPGTPASLPEPGSLAALGLLLAPVVLRYRTARQ